jgi:hypothetical protein
MTSFFFNLIRGNPTSPSTPETSFFNSDEQNKEILLKNAVVDYCGVFDCNSMKWTSRLPTTSTTTSNSSPTTSYTPHCDASATRNQNGLKTGFVEQHLSLQEINNEYQNVHVKYLESTNNKKKPEQQERSRSISRNATTTDKDVQLASTKRSIVRIVSISDTHQFAHHVTLPRGDILVHQGDVLMSDRLNPSFISNYYITEFLDWLNSQPFAAKIFICGNHDLQFAQLGVEKIRELCRTPKYKNIHFLAADCILDVFGVRFYGNSFSHGKSPNKAFQDVETFKQLQKEIPYDNIVDGLKQHILLPTTTGENNNNNNNNKLIRRKDDSRAVDFFLTHSRLHSKEGIAILQKINPLVHLVGHEHEEHGMNLGTHDRSVDWKSDMTKRFARRATTAASELWSYLFSSLSPVVVSAAGSSSTENNNNNNNVNAIKTIFIDNLIPELNGSIVAELHKWNPVLHPPLVFDVIPYEEEKAE